MTTELVGDTPSQAAQVVPAGMQINGILDWAPIVGVPLWVFITFFLMFCIAGIWVYWIARIRKLNAVSGWRESLNHEVDEVQVWLITRTLNLVIGCMKIEDNVLSYRDKSKIGMWHHNTRESVIRVGGNPAVIVSEDYDQTRDPISEIALTDNADQFNADQQALKDEHQKMGNTSPVMETINSYGDYSNHGRRDLEFVNPNGLPMKSYSVLNFSRFLKYFPKGCSHMFFGGVLRRDARKMKAPREKQGFWSRFGIPILVVIVVLVAIAASYFVPLG